MGALGVIILAVKAFKLWLSFKSTELNLIKTYEYIQAYYIYKVTTYFEVSNIL